MQDAEAKWQKLMEDSSDMLFPDALCSQIVQRKFPDKDRERSAFFIVLSGPATVLNVPGLKV
jgi:hypothetical protein